MRLPRYAPALLITFCVIAMALVIAPLCVASPGCSGDDACCAGTTRSATVRAVGGGTTMRLSIHAAPRHLAVARMSRVLSPSEREPGIPSLRDVSPLRI